MTYSLHEAIEAGQPLIELFLRFKDGVNYKLGTKLLNALGNDIEFDTGDWYNDPRTRIGQVTADGARRLFNAEFVRVPLEKWDEETQTHQGYWDDVYCWSQTEITQWPSELESFIEGIGATQPGANDIGQAYTPSCSG